MTPLTVCRGLAAKAGYTYLDQGTIHWHQIDQNQPMEEWLGWMNNADLKRLPQVSPEKFNAWYHNTEAKEELRKAS